MQTSIVKTGIRIKSPRESFHLGAAAWLISCLTVAALLVWRALPAARAPAVVSHRLAAAKATPFAKPIEQIRVGERVLARNPELESAEPTIRDVDAANWRHITLQSVKLDGSTIDIQLLREVEWVKAVGAEPGREIIDLDLEEFGADGPATVIAVAPCPPISPGTGSIVTGTFSHTARRVIDVHIEGHKPIGCTDNHLFWSSDRHQFVPAGELKVGENLSTVSNGFLQVAAISPRGAPEPVYNLEVDIQHVYYVSDLGVLVHNSCNNPLRGNMMATQTFRAGDEAAHIVAAGKMTGRSAYIQRMLERTRTEFLLKKAGIHFHDPLNGAIVERVLHQTLHTDRVFRKVSARIRLASRGGRASVIWELRSIADDMVYRPWVLW